MDTTQKSNLKQAIVFIHGIGEQQPMKTLRDLVDALQGENEIYRSKPDGMSESFELRCLQLPSDRMNKRPITDFYEYYWAHHMTGGRYRAVLTWLRRLLSRPWGEVPKQLRPTYCLIWGLLPLFLLALVVLTFQIWSESSVEGVPLGSIKLPVHLVLSLIALAIIAWLVLRALSDKIVLGYVADAARYLAPDPDNIAQRNAIRAEGVELLRSLHASGRYFRIVVVGHSLGSVIGYDIIRHLWDELRTSHAPNPCKQPCAEGFDAKVQDLYNKEQPLSIEHFQQLQHELWREHRQAGIPWLVTDFITLGSPLSHAPLLLAENKAAFKRRQKELEYPRCPPQPDPEDGKTHYRKPYYPVVSQLEPHKIMVPNRGAPYASTRWTNLYFPSNGGLRGDLIGGPLATHFGLGVRDIPVSLGEKRWWKGFLNSHVHYWDVKATGKDGSLDVLRNALCLESLRDEAWPPPTPLRPRHASLSGKS